MNRPDRMPDEGGAAAGNLFPVRLGRFLFRWRGWTAVPPAILLILFCHPRLLWAIPGTIGIVTGEAIRLRALQFIGGDSRSRKMGGKSLVTEGPFVLHRNPLYFGNFLLTLGFSLLSGNPWFLLVPAVLFPLQYVPIIIAEEAELFERFGRSYGEYARRTPRFFPRPPRLPARMGTPRHRLTEAIRIDRSTLRSVVLLTTALAIAGVIKRGG